MCVRVCVCVGVCVGVCMGEIYVHVYILYIYHIEICTRVHIHVLF